MKLWISSPLSPPTPITLSVLWGNNKLCQETPGHIRLGAGRPIANQGIRTPNMKCLRRVTLLQAYIISLHQVVSPFTPLSTLTLYERGDDTAFTITRTSSEIEGICLIQTFISPQQNFLFLPTCWVFPLTCDFTYLVGPLQNPCWFLAIDSLNPTAFYFCPSSTCNYNITAIIIILLVYVIIQCYNLVIWYYYWLYL